jgi:hypothetical protein
MSTAYETSCSCSTTANADVLEFKEPDIASDFTLTQVAGELAAANHSLAKYLNTIQFVNNNSSGDDDIVVYMKQSEHADAADFLNKLLFPVYSETDASENNFLIGHLWEADDSVTDTNFSLADTVINDPALRYGCAAQLFTAYNSLTVFGNAQSTALLNAENETIDGMSKTAKVGLANSGVALLEQFFPTTALTGLAGLSSYHTLTTGLPTDEPVVATYESSSHTKWYSVRLEEFETAANSVDKKRCGIHEIISAMVANDPSVFQTNNDQDAQAIPTIVPGTDTISFYYTMVAPTLTLRDDSSNGRIATVLNGLIGHDNVATPIIPLSKPHIKLSASEISNIYGKANIAERIYKWTLRDHVVKVIAY